MNFIHAIMERLSSEGHETGEYPGAASRTAEAKTSFEFFKADFNDSIRLMLYFQKPTDQVQKDNRNAYRYIYKRGAAQTTVRDLPFQYGKPNESIDLLS